MGSKRTATFALTFAMMQRKPPAPVPTKRRARKVWPPRLAARARQASNQMAMPVWMSVTTPPRACARAPTNNLAPRVWPPRLAVHASPGFKPDGDFCVDVCDDDAKTACSNANKQACSPLNAACGACLEGFVSDVGDTCAVRQACSAADGSLTCTSPAIKDDDGTCAGKLCDASIDFGDATKACCMDDVCDAAAKAACSAANKQSCSPGTTTCGICKDGFVTDTGDTCVAKQMCSAADPELACTSPAIKDGTGTCAGKQCDAAVDFGDTSKACCMYDVCDNAAKSTCSSANKASCSPGETACGDCLTGLSWTATCVSTYAMMPSKRLRWCKQGALCSWFDNLRWLLDWVQA